MIHERFCCKRADPLLRHVSRPAGLAAQPFNVLFKYGASPFRTLLPQGDSYDTFTEGPHLTLPTRRQIPQQPLLLIRVQQ